VSPGEYHRAHAYSNAFGGAGSAANVAWWGKDKETTWTTNEEKVRGGGIGQIADWKPGDTETGTYTVTRDLFGSVDFCANYDSKLIAGATWGLDDGRAAWGRVKTLLTDGSKDMIEAKRVKGVLAGTVDNYMKQFIVALGYGKAGALLIDKMKMDYQIKTTGTGAGTSRANLAITVNADNVDATKFGLKDEPENIWKAMVSANVGFFKKKPLATFNKRSKREGVKVPPVNLSPQLDGWGIP
jgi:hypothetical protein